MIPVGVTRQAVLIENHLRNLTRFGGNGDSGRSVYPMAEAGLQALRRVDPFPFLTDDSI